MTYLHGSGDGENARNPSLPDKDGVPAELGIQLHEFLQALGFKAERAGELNAAYELYGRAVALEPKSALSWYNFGDVLLALNRQQEAANALAKAVELSPGNSLYRYDLGLALFGLGHFEMAAKQFMAVAAADPELKRASSSLGASALTSLALSLERLGDLDNAIRTLRPAVKMATDVLYNMGHLYFRARKQAQALVFAQAAATVDPQKEDAVHLCGRLLLNLGRESEAADYLRRATRLNPKCQDAWYDLGLTLARLGKRILARPCFMKVLRLNPGHAWAHYDLACLDALKRRKDQAFSRLEKAISHGFDAVGHLRKDPDLKSLRTDPRWLTLPQKIRQNRKSSAR